MKIAFTASENSMNTMLDQRFGRANGFLIYDTEAKSHYYVSNEINMQAAQGAGIQSASRIAEEKVDVLISGHCGPKAFQVLKASGVKIYTSDSVKISDALSKLQNGELQEISSPDVSGHW